jgi:hypothetical protein
MQAMNPKLEEIQGLIDPLRQKIVQHSIYTSIQDLTDLHPFMEHHVFAVWDFMSLLKGLQNELTCTTIPWVPVGAAETRYLINEIVVGEESDELPDGRRISHFELYLDAMAQAGASTTKMEQLLSTLQSGVDIIAALQKCELPEGVKRFVSFTFDIIRSGKAHVMAAVFTFGREDLIPDMFRVMVDDLNRKFPEAMGTFKYYLDRHIEVDGDHHSHLALSMTATLCGDNQAYWAEAKEAVLKALEMRQLLWDSVLLAIEERKSSIPS